MNINSNDKSTPFLSSSSSSRKNTTTNSPSSSPSSSPSPSFLVSLTSTLCSDPSLLRQCCPRKRRVALVDRFELDAWQRWRKYRVFPRSLILHLFAISVATMMVVLLNTSLARYSYDSHFALTSILFPADEPNWNGNGLTYPGDEYFLHSIDKVNESFFALPSNYFTMDYRSYPNDQYTALTQASMNGTTRIQDLDGPLGPMDYIECYPASSSSVGIAVPSLSFTILAHSRYQESEYYTTMMNYLDTLIPYPSSSSSSHRNNNPNASFPPTFRVTIDTDDNGNDDITVTFPTLDNFYQWSSQTIPDDASTAIFFQSVDNLQYNLQFRTYNLAKGSTTGSTCMLWTFTVPFELSSHGVTRIYAIDDFTECDGGGWNGPEATGNWSGTSPLLITGLLMVLLAFIQQGTLIRQDVRITRLMRWTVILGQTTRYFAHAHLRLRALKAREQCIALGILGADKLPNVSTHSRYNIRKFRLRLSCLSFFLTCCGCRKDHHHHLHQSTTVVQSNENNVPVLNEEHYSDDIEIDDDTATDDILPLTTIVKNTNNNQSEGSNPGSKSNWKQRINFTNDTNNKDIQNVIDYQEQREQQILDEDVARIKRFLEAYLRSGATQTILFSDYLDILARRRRKTGGKSSSGRNNPRENTNTNTGNTVVISTESKSLPVIEAPVIDSSALNDLIGLDDDMDEDEEENNNDDADEQIIRRYSIAQQPLPLGLTGSINAGFSTDRRRSSQDLHTQSAHSIHSSGSGGVHQPLRSLAHQAAINEKKLMEQQQQHTLTNNGNFPRSRRASIVGPNQQIMTFPVTRSRVSSDHLMGTGGESGVSFNDVSSALTGIALAQQQQQEQQSTGAAKERTGLPPRPTKSSPSSSKSSSVPSTTDLTETHPSSSSASSTIPTYTYSPLQKALQTLSTTTIHVHHSHALELLSPWSLFKTVGNICTGLFASIMLISGRPLLGKNLSLLLAIGGALEWISLMQYLKHHGSFYLFSRMFKKGMPSVMRNMLATVPIFVAFMILGCMLFGNLTERFDGIQWSSIALFAVANGDVVRETFQVTLQYQDSVPTRLLALLFMYAYTASFIYVMLKTTTAITEEAFLLTRPPPKDLTPDSKVYAIPGVEGIKESDFKSTASSRSSLIDGDDGTSVTTIDAENSAVEEYRLPDDIRHVLVAMQIVRDQGGAIAPLITACTEFAALSVDKQVRIIERGWLPFSMNALTKTHTREGENSHDNNDKDSHGNYGGGNGDGDGESKDPNGKDKNIAVPLQQLMNLMGRILQGGTDEENERQLLGPGPNHFYNELQKKQQKEQQQQQDRNQKNRTGTIDNTNSINSSNRSINDTVMDGRTTSLELSERPKTKNNGKSSNRTITSQRRTSGISNSSNSSRYGSFDQNDPTLRKEEKYSSTYQPPKM